MGKLIIVAPQAEPVVFEHEGEVTLEVLNHHLGEEVTVDVVRLGTIPPHGRHADLWIDDNGLLDDRVKPNRVLPNGTTICGVMLICAGDDSSGQSLPLTDTEALFVARDIGQRWIALPADHPKPEPQIFVTEWTP